MEGAALAAKQRLDVATYTAWHTATFGLNGYAGKLKPLHKYLGDEAKPDSRQLQHAKAIAFFHRLQAKGVDVKITRH